MDNLPITEELDFEYLLAMMPALYDKPGFSWLAELFSIIGAEKLVLLCKYAGGETITIPTIDEVSSSVEALQLFYDIKIKKIKSESDVPPALSSKFKVICKVYDNL